MYGLVNNGVRTYLIDNHGPEVWEKVCMTAGIDQDDFETMEAYDDAITYNLVGAISEVLNLSAEQVLEVFGTFWVDYAQSTAVGKLIARSGDDFWERLRGLDDMHALRKMGCNAFQSFHYGVPMSQDAATCWMRDQAMHQVRSSA